MYNIFTVLNEGYTSFGKMLVSSLFDKVDLSRVGEIIICDTGLSEESVEYYNCFPKVRVVDSGLNTQYGLIHDDDWKKNVYSKAKLLLSTVEGYEEFVPTIMIDSDCIIIEDFFDLLEGDYDIAPCLRNQAGRAPGHQATSSHIGSFFVIKKKSAIPFLADWIEEIPRITDVGPDGKRIPQESPALSNTCKKYKERIKILDLDERVMANIEQAPPPMAKIYHLKSDWLYLTIDRRLSQPRVRYYYSRYLGG